jgi:hypothetical protein
MAVVLDVVAITPISTPVRVDRVLREGDDLGWDLRPRSSKFPVTLRAASPSTFLPNVCS